MSYWTVPKQWPGTVVVMASGPSLTAEDAAAVKHLPRIVTNATFKIAPDAEIVYGSDAQFWHAYPDAIRCTGSKVCIEQVRGVAPNVPPGVVYLRNGGPSGVSDDPGSIKTGSNSGYAAVQIAVLSGASRILLLGLDLYGTHWHGTHPKPLSNPLEFTFRRWVKSFNQLAPALTARNIEVLNCSQSSALNCFPKVDLRKCL